MQKLAVLGLLFTLVALVGFTDAQEKDKKKRMGSLAGVLKSRKLSPNGKNSIVEVLASGEEKARSYRVQYDQKAKGPIPAVLEKVRAAQIGDRVQLDWIDTGEGLAITTFEVLKKSANNKEDAKDNK